MGIETSAWISMAGAVVSIAMLLFTINERRHKIRERLFDLRFEFVKEISATIQESVMMATSVQNSVTFDAALTAGKRLEDLRLKLLKDRLIANVLLNHDSLVALDTFLAAIFRVALLAGRKESDTLGDRVIECTQAYEEILLTFRDSLQVSTLDKLGRQSLPKKWFRH